MKKLLPVLALVSLLFVGMLPVVEAPNFGSPKWDILYDVRAKYPEQEGWARDTLGTTSRAFQYHNQVLNITMDSAGTDYEMYTIPTPSSSFLMAEARLKIPVGGVQPTLEFNNTIEPDLAHLIISSTKISIDIYDPSMQAVLTSDHYEENIIGSNHTYTMVVFTLDGRTYIQAYYDGNLVIEVSVADVLDFNQFWFEARDSGGGTKYCEWDYIALSTSDLTSQIDDLEDEISELERRIKELEKQIHSDNPVVVNETELPYVPFGNRGLDDDVQFIDPYRTIEFTTRVSGSGSDLSFYLPYPTAEEVTVLSDEIWIAPESYTRLWINDTAGSGTELLNVSTSVTYYNIEWGYNITVQTSGASSTVRADRVTIVRLVDSFNWGWNRDSGIFAHQSVIENEIAYDMEVVRCYWAFPDEDADGRDVQIDVASIEVWDADNNIQLSKGHHYEATEAGGVYLLYRWVNTSGTTASRTIRIQFTRASLVQGESFYTVYDNDISISDTYNNAPFTTNVHHTQAGTANFEGKVIIKFALSGRYSGEKVDVRTLIIKRSDISLAQQYTYDSISNELRIVDQTVDAGESITYTLYFDFYDEKSAVYELILGDPLVIYSLLLLAGASGLFIFLDATKEEKRRKYAGLIIIGVDVIILIIILVAG